MTIFTNIIRSKNVNKAINDNYLHMGIFNGSNAYGITWWIMPLWGLNSPPRPIGIITPKSPREEEKMTIFTI
jgi:hypothetical protein